MLKKLDHNISSHAHFEASASSNVGKNKGRGFFVVKHFAGDVTYAIDGFLEKNKDTLFSDLIDLMGSSKNSFIANLFPHQTSKKRPPTGK